MGEKFESKETKGEGKEIERYARNRVRENDN